MYNREINRKKIMENINKNLEIKEITELISLCNNEIREYKELSEIFLDLDDLEYFSTQIMLLNRIIKKLKNKTIKNVIIEFRKLFIIKLLSL